jgi:hypothetical protein
VSRSSGSGDLKRGSGRHGVAPPSIHDVASMTIAPAFQASAHGNGSGPSSFLGQGANQPVRARADVQAWARDRHQQQTEEDEGVRLTERGVRSGGLSSSASGSSSSGKALGVSGRKYAAADAASSSSGPDGSKERTVPNSYR